MVLAALQTAAGRRDEEGVMMSRLSTRKATFQQDHNYMSRRRLALWRKCGDKPLQAGSNRIGPSSSLQEDSLHSTNSPTATEASEADATPA
jgi:hypothetical protein